MKDDKIVVRTLSMMQANSSHTGEYICALLMQALDEYNINYSQVHSITTDNGKNVLKSVELFGVVEHADVFTNDAFNLNELFSDDCLLDNNINISEDAPECDDGAEIIDEDQASLSAAIEMFETRTKILSGIRCAAHTLQLVINTALKTTEYAKKLISKCRRVVKYLLAPNMLNLIRQQNLRYPKIDCLTRWSSTYYMLEGLVELKEFYVSMISFMPTKCKMNESDWHNLEGILKILHYFETLTLKLQAVNFTVSDFYAAWQELKMEMESLAGVELVDNILIQMDVRESDMMRNDIIYSCIFMDPRYRILLNEGICFSINVDSALIVWSEKVFLAIFHCDNPQLNIVLFLNPAQIKRHEQSNISPRFRKRNADYDVKNIKQSKTIFRMLRMRKMIAFQRWK